MATKICSKCKIEKSFSEFYKGNDTNGLAYCCIVCKKKYNNDNAPHISKQTKQYKENNALQILEWNRQYNKTNNKRKKQYYKKHASQIIKQHKHRRKRGAFFEVYSKKLEIFERVRRCPENLEFLQVRCAYCGTWTIPTNLQVNNRIQAFNGTQSGEQRFYCSKACKSSCPTYRQKDYWRGQTKEQLGTSREVDAWFRQLVLETDNWTCQKCGASKDEDQELILHAHHINGVAQQPVLQNDIDNAITLCIECHKKVHKTKNCTYFNLRRSKCKT